MKMFGVAGFFMKYLYFIFMALIFSCSSTSGPKHEVKTKLVGDAILPESVSLFINLKQDDSVDYEIATFKAATDLVNLGKIQMESYNSGDALRYLSLGAHLMPFRGDVKHLYLKAIDNYVTVTNKMISSKSFTCSELATRIDFLKTVSPDSLLALGKMNNGCSYNTASNNNDFIFSKVSGQKQEKPQFDYEKYATVNLSKDLDYLLKMNEFLPVTEIMNIAFEGLGDLRIDSKNIELSSYTKDSENIYIEVDSEINKDKSTGETALDTCKKFKDLLNIEIKKFKGPIIKCGYDWDSMGGVGLDIKVSPKNINFMSNSHSIIPFRYSNGLIAPVLVFDFDFVYRDGKAKKFKYIFKNEMNFYDWERLKRQGVRNEDILFLPYQSDNQELNLSYDLEFSRLYEYYSQQNTHSQDTKLEVDKKIKSDFRFQMPVVRFISEKFEQGSLKFVVYRLKRNEIEGLVAVNVGFNRNETYKMWREELKSHGFWH
jgi:hypothetical protein